MLIKHSSESIIAQKAAMNINLQFVKTIVANSRCGNLYPHTFAEIVSRRSMVELAVTYSCPRLRHNVFSALLLC